MRQPVPVLSGRIALPAWRLAASILTLGGAGLLWLLMISSTYDGLYFEPTSSAISRATEVQPQIRWTACGSLLLTALLALAARRRELLLLATPAVLVLAFGVVSQDSAAAIIGVTSTPFAIIACLIVLALHRVRRPHVPWTIVFAAQLSTLDAMALDTLAAVLAFEQITGRGRLGAEHLTGLSLRGLLGFIAVLLLVAVLLWSGATRLLDSGRHLLIVVPLCCFMTIGTIGEIADLAGDTSPRSDLTGLGILALAGLPVLLLATRHARSWRRDRRPSSQHPPPFPPTAAID